MAIGFFMKIAKEERIQTFDIAVRKAADDDWTTVISRKESSGEFGTIETFPFSARTAFYVRFESHGNDFNNWTALTEVEICGKSVGESNAVFGGVKAIGKELEMLAGQVCAEPTKIGFAEVRDPPKMCILLLVSRGSHHTKVVASAFKGPTGVPSMIS